MKKILPFVFLGMLASSSCSYLEGKSLSEEFTQKMQSARSAELGTLECRICKIIKADDNISWYKFGERKILFECKGTVKIGIDLDTPESYKVDIDEAAKSITLTLPKAKILAINLKPEDTRLAYEKVSMTRCDFNSEERTALLRQGEVSIREDVAKNAELQKEAEANARNFFAAMLKQMGFKNIIINFA